MRARRFRGSWDSVYTTNLDLAPATALAYPSRRSRPPRKFSIASVDAWVARSSTARMRSGDWRASVGCTPVTSSGRGFAELVDHNDAEMYGTRFVVSGVMSCRNEARLPLVASASAAAAASGACVLPIEDEAMVATSLTRCSSSRSSLLL